MRGMCDMSRSKSQPVSDGGPLNSTTPLGDSPRRGPHTASQAPPAENLRVLVSHREPRRSSETHTKNTSRRGNPPPQKCSTRAPDPKVCFALFSKKSSSVVALKCTHRQNFKTQTDLSEMHYNAARSSAPNPILAQREPKCHFPDAKVHAQPPKVQNRKNGILALAGL